MTDINRPMTPGSSTGRCKPLQIWIVVAISTFVGIWWLYEAANAAVYVVLNDRSWRMFSIYQTAAMFGCCLIVGSVLLLRNSRVAVIPFMVIALASVVRWVLNWKFVFPFSERTSNLHSLGFLELWSTHQFAFALVSSGMAAIVLVDVLGRHRSR